MLLDRTLLLESLIQHYCKIATISVTQAPLTSLDEFQSVYSQLKLKWWIQQTCILFYYLLLLKTPVIS